MNISMAHVLENVRSATPPPKHMTARGYMGNRTTINLDVLAQRCAERNVDVNDIIAEALTIELREEMGIRAQADLAWKIMDKLEASKKAVELGNNKDNPFTLILQSADLDI